jgi:citrate synthase
LGIPADEFTCMFACGRMAGWTAHILEQLADNRLIRPQAAYTGPAVMPFTPIEERGRNAVNGSDVHALVGNA